MRNLFFCCLIFLMAVAFLSAGGQTETAAAREIRIGCAVAMTGRVSPEGNASREGLQVWEKFVNDRGGIDVGGEKYTVRVIFYDDKSDPITGAKLTEKLITQDDVHFLVGPFSSGITFATSAIGEKYGIITVAPLGNATNVYERGFKNVFSILPPAPQLMLPTIDLAAQMNNPKPKTVGIITANDLFPINVRAGLEIRIKELGLELIVDEKYTAESSDVTTLLTMAKAKNPDIFLFIGYTKDAIMVVRQAKEVGFAPKFFASSVGMHLPEYLPSLGKDGNFVVEAEWWLPDMMGEGPIFGKTSDYVKAFQDMHGYVPDYHHSCGSAAGVVLQLAIERAGSLDTDAVREELLEMQGQRLSCFPELTFNEKGQNVSGEHPVIQVQNEQYRTVYPLNDQFKLIYPFPAWDQR